MKLSSLKEPLDKNYCYGEQNFFYYNFIVRYFVIVISILFQKKNIKAVNAEAPRRVQIFSNFIKADFVFNFFNFLF